MIHTASLLQMLMADIALIFEFDAIKKAVFMVVEMKPGEFERARIIDPYSRNLPSSP